MTGRGAFADLTTRRQLLATAAAGAMFSTVVKAEKLIDLPLPGGPDARTITTAELMGLEGVYEQGTNLHHALALAGRHLRRHPNAQPVLLVVTDGEPTAHLEDLDGDGSAVFFDYPPHPRTIAHTVRGFDDMARLGAQVTIFRLGSDPGLARFIDQVARRVEGRVVVPDLDGLGAAVVGDYLRSRRRR